MKACTACILLFNILQAAFAISAAAQQRTWTARASAAVAGYHAGFHAAQRHHQRQHQRLHQYGPVTLHKSCDPGCERNGNCNRALGVCECPVGYIGPDCSKPLWPSCKVTPEQLELYCSNDWFPKSCECLKQCAAFVCPDGTHASCERDFDMFNSKCFLRSNTSNSSTSSNSSSSSSSSSTESDVAWDGGSDLPEDTEEGVKYYKGWLHKDHTREITREEMTEVGIIEDVDPVNPLVALPLSSCPLKCSSQGGCVRRKHEILPFCACHYGFQGEFCEQRAERTDLQNVCWNNCQGRGTCRRGFCHCQPGWWGKDCSSSAVFAPHSARRPVHKLRVYMYDLPWTVAYQPEYQLGWRDHDQNYLAWKVFGQMFLNDTVIRTENPWEANLFYIPAMTYAFSENTGNSVLHSKRAIDYVRTHWPFFNRSQGLDHFIWLTGDRGACDWPADAEPHLANIIKVVHFGWHHPGAKAGVPKGWEGHIKNKLWGCFNPLRDIVAAAYWQTQTKMAQQMLGGTMFDVHHIPTERLLFFSGSIRSDSLEYSQGVRQQLYHMYGNGSNPQVLIHEGGMHPDDYAQKLNSSKFCLAPSGYGWGIRLNYYMVTGCVPVIIQDDIYQPWEDQLPYSEFGVRLPHSSIPDIVGLLSEISDAEYLQLRAGLAKHWRAFVWDKSVGGMAYDYMIRSLKDRMLRLQARHYHPIHSRPKSQPHAATSSMTLISGLEQGTTHTVAPHDDAAHAATSNMTLTSGFEQDATHTVAPHHEAEHAATSSMTLTSGREQGATHTEAPHQAGHAATSNMNLTSGLEPVTTNITAPEQLLAAHAAVPLERLEQSAAGTATLEQSEASDAVPAGPAAGGSQL